MFFAQHRLSTYHSERLKKQTDAPSPLENAGKTAYTHNLPTNPQAGESLDGIRDVVLIRELNPEPMSIVIE